MASSDIDSMTTLAELRGALEIAEVTGAVDISEVAGAVDIAEVSGAIDIADVTGALYIAEGSTVSAGQLSGSVTLEITQGPEESTMVTNTDEDVSSLPGELLKKGFRFAPPKIREIIFRQYFPKYNYLHNQEIPTLLKALEIDNELYEEALAVYSKQTIFGMSWDNVEGKMDMLSPSLIQNLQIAFKCVSHTPWRKNFD